MIKTKIFDKKFLVKYALIPLIASFIGGMVALILLPISKGVEQHFWNKQNHQLVYQKTVEKRLELLDLYIQKKANFKFCSMRVGFESYLDNYKTDALSCYLSAQAELMGVVVQIRYYYKGDVEYLTHKFSEQGEKYEAQMWNGFNLNEEYDPNDKTIIEFYQTMEELVEKMKSHIYDEI